MQPGDVPEPFELKRGAGMPEYRTQVANTVNRVSEDTSSYTPLPRGTITMAEQTVREQRIYQTKDPFHKSRGAAFLREH